MRFGLFLFLSVPIVLVLAISSCKDKDELPPDISILTPSEGTIYSVYDTVFTSFEISDETQLTQASVELVNSNFIPVTPKTVVQNYNGSAALVIDDKLLETGDYYVLITALDGTNETREFRKIKVVALPKERRAIYVGTGAASGNATVWKIDSLFQQPSLWIQPGQDMFKLCVDSKYDQLTLAGFFSTGLRTYDINSRTLAWSDDVFSVSQTQRYMDLTCFNSSVFTTIYDREIRSYSQLGTLTMNIPTEEYRPEEIYTDGNYLLVDMNLVGDNRNILNVYNFLTRALIWQTEFQADIVSVCPLEGDEVLIFGNANDQAKVFHFDMGSNTWWEPRELPQGRVLKAVATEGNRFVISHDNGLYSYTYSPNYLNQIRAGYFQDVSFDTDNGTIIAANDNVLEVMTPIGQTINTISLNDSIVSFDIHYTR